MQVYATPIEEKKEFTFCGDILKQREHNETTGLWLYERWSPRGFLVGYEVVKGKKHKNPDGTIIFTYPSSEDFGSYGLFYPPRTNRDSLVKSLSIPMCKETREERNKTVFTDWEYNKKGEKVFKGGIKA